MATLALAAAGAAAGSTVGYAALGWSIGAAIGSVLFTPGAQDIVQDGARLGDLALSASTYGASINVGYGVPRLNGQVIWLRGGKVEERISSEKQSGGKGFVSGIFGGGSVTQNRYSYFGTFSLGISEGDVDDVLRIWADNNLIYDKTGISDVQRSTALDFTLYPGTETQDQDPLMVEALGETNTSAHRGLAHLVFDRMPLAAYGNRIPNLNVEVAFSGTPIFPRLDLTNPFDTTFPTSFLVDWDRGFIWGVYSDGNSDMVIRRARIRDMVVDRTRTYVGEKFGNLGGVMPDSGNLIVYLSGGNSSERLLIDGDSLQIIGRFGFGGGSSTHSPTQFGTPSGTSDSCAAIVFGAAGAEEYHVTASLFTSVGVLKVDPNDLDTLQYVWDNETAGPPVLEARIHGVAEGVRKRGETIVYMLSGSRLGSTADTVFWHITIESGAFYHPSGAFPPVGVKMEEIARYAPGDFDPTWTTVRAPYGFVVDQADNNPIFQTTKGDLTEDRWLKINWETGAIIWNVLLPPLFFGLNNPGGWQQSRVTNGRLARMPSNTLYVVDTATGEITGPEGPWAGSAYSSTGVQIYDDEREVIIMAITGSADLTKITPYRGNGDPAALDLVVADLCDRSDELLPADYDVTDLEGETVEAFVLSQQAPSRSAVEFLASGYFFDIIESDGQIKFLTMGKSSVATIPQLELGQPDSGNEYWRPTRAQEENLPQRVTLKYLDKERDQQQGAAPSPRITLPRPTSYANAQTTFELPITFVPVTAKRIAEITLFATWEQRDRFVARLGTKHLLLDPADVIDVDLDNGESYHVKIAKEELGAVGFAKNLEFKSEESSMYSSLVNADGGQGFPVQEVLGNELSRLFVLDLPLLRDQDAAAVNLSRYYYAVTHYDDGARWDGAAIFLSSDAIEFARRTQIILETAHGGVVEFLADTTHVFSPDQTNTLDVVMSIGAGQLASISQTDLLNGGNAAVVGDEVIQFRDVADNGDGTFTLSYLLRGRRGTDTETGGHAVGESFILLDQLRMEIDSTLIELLNTPIFYRAVSTGGSYDQSQIISQILTGRDLKPYAPVNATRTDDTPASGDITFGYLRRTRIGGELQTLFDTVPLNEDVESYEIDVLDGAGGAVLRTLVSATETLVYLAADIVTDFGTPPAIQHVKIYQMSAQVGRGSAYEFALA